MALARERTHQSSQSAFAQGLDPSSLEFFGLKGHHASMIEESGCSHGHVSTLFDPNNPASAAFANSPQHDHQVQSIVNFKGVAPNYHWNYPTSSSVLSFEQGHRSTSINYPNVDQEEECAIWIDNMDRDYQSSHASSRVVARDVNCFEIGSGYGSTDDQCGEEHFNLLYTSATTDVDSFRDGGEIQRGLQKRPFMGGDMQAPKKHSGNSRKAKAKPNCSPSKDPQSIAAKNRRERISERLKVLQDLVPNGTKVDLVTMLEKAISYVKFLQLQVKVLATDEFWPAQGGKAPEISQVKEAIDAILSSHRERSSSSKQ